LDEKTRLKLATRNLVGHYRLGHEQIALLLASALFESLIDSLQNAAGWDDNTSLENKINTLPVTTLSKFSEYFLKLDRFYPKSCSNWIAPNQPRRRLHNFRQLRNRIVHGNINSILSGQRDKIEDLIAFLWSQLAPKSFDKAYQSRQQGQKSVFKTLFEHSADYMVRGLSEVEFLSKDEKTGQYEDRGKDPKNHRIAAVDFENLFTLREKMVFLKYYISQWLDENQISLKTDILTIIDTTSGYIWMPLVPKNSASDGRASVYECSVSLLATPFDFRIYMDFGGYQREKRKLYYKFLSDSPEYKEVVNRLTNKPCLKVFDIDWYFSKSNERLFSKWLLSKDDDLAKANEKIASARRPESSPITWNRCLHGYVFSKQDLGDGYIDFSRMENKLQDIIELYCAFLNYEQRVAEETA